LVNFEINFLANICVRDWGKEALSRARIGQSPVVLGHGKVN